MGRFKRLKLKIKEIYDNQELFSKAMGISKTALNQRLNGVIEWKSSDIVKACELLNIDLKDAYLYFFEK